MAEYTLVITKEAEFDLANLYDDGFKRWGEAQTDKYYDDLLGHFDALCDNPYLYRAVEEIRAGYPLLDTFVGSILIIYYAQNLTKNASHFLGIFLKVAL